MDLFKVFDDKTKKEFLTAPLNHPNINYGWMDKKMEINGISYNIIYIGNIIDDGSIRIIKFDNEDIGFYDKNNNFITPILLHPFNLKNEGYKKIYNALKNDFRDIPKKEVKDTSDNVIKLIKLLDEDVPFYMDVLKYIRTQKFDFSKENEVQQGDIDDLISFVNTQGKDIISEYPHLKLMVNILVNKAV